MSTGRAFSRLQAPKLTSQSFKSGADGGAPEFGCAEDVIAYMKQLPNDLTPPAKHVAPLIDEVLTALQALPGCLIARLSGSGATCFGLFETRSVAQEGAALLSKQQPDWWVCPGQLRS